MDSAGSSTASWTTPSDCPLCAPVPLCETSMNLTQRHGGTEGGNEYAPVVPTSLHLTHVEHHSRLWFAADPRIHIGVLACLTSR